MYTFSHSSEFSSYQSLSPRHRRLRFPPSGDPLPFSGRRRLLCDVGPPSPRARSCLLRPERRRQIQRVVPRTINADRGAAKRERASSLSFRFAGSRRARIITPLVRDERNDESALWTRGTIRDPASEPSREKSNPRSREFATRSRITRVYRRDPRTTSGPSRNRCLMARGGGRRRRSLETRPRGRARSPKGKTPPGRRAPRRRGETE